MAVARYVFSRKSLYKIKMSIFSWYLENEDLTLILRGKMEAFADASAFNVGVKETMPICHKIIFKHIFHKRKSLYMLLKGKCICMLKWKFCVASCWFLTIVMLFVFVFLFFIWFSLLICCCFFDFLSNIMCFVINFC
jgi:hypothetical protein